MCFSERISLRDRRLRGEERASVVRRTTSASRKRTLYTSTKLIRNVRNAPESTKMRVNTRSKLPGGNLGFSLVAGDATAAATAAGAEEVVAAAAPAGMANARISFLFRF
jgi:hypothetical protein